MRRSTHYHIEHQGRRDGRPFLYRALAQQAIMAALGATGTPSGFLPVTVPCHDDACLDPPPAYVKAGQVDTRISTGSRFCG